MNWKRLITSLVIVAILVAGGYWAYAKYLAPKPETESATAVAANTIAIDTGVDSVAAEAQVLPREHALLAFEIGGPVVEILIEEGQTVQAGDPLLRLDARDQEIILQQAETAVLQAQSQLAAAQTGQAAAEVGLTAANTAVAAAQAELDLLTADPTEEQIALQEAQVAAAQAGIQQASGSQAVVLEGATSAEVGVAEAELAAAQAELFAARVQYEPLAQNEDAGTDAREQAQLRLNAAIANAEAAQAQLDELRAGATGPERQAAAGAVGAAVGQQEAAAAQLDLLLAGSRPEAIAVAQANLEQAQRAVAEAELGVQQAETAVAQAEAGVAEAETAVTQAQALLNKMTLTAPFAGTVANIAIKEGEVAQPGVPVITLADFSAWQIETTDLNELNIVAVKVGDPVNVTIDAFPGEKLRGQVSDIASASSLTRGDVTYAVTIALDEVTLPLRWGMTAF
ncbi:MAG: HlyD family efflux transporter periplasmic adaptor subunit, partial [Anaerolineales bacterium]|nr:HlyD family efflux transporter periplasmic adaptor subunit [Anaerolineales bacterium]